MMNLRIPFLKSQGGWLSGRAAGIAALVVAVAAIVSLPLAGIRLLSSDGVEAADAWTFGVSLAAMIVCFGFLTRSYLRARADSLARALVGTLEFPVFFLRDRFWLVLFGGGGAGFLYGLYQLALSHASSWHLYLTAISAAAIAAGAVVHLLRHRWAGIFSMIAGVLLLAPGLWLLSSESGQIASYNKAMQARPERDLAGELKALEASQAAYVRSQQASQLWKLIFPEPQTYLAARGFFHESNVLAQTPNKGKQAYEALTRSLTLNPGNRTIGLTAEEAARDELDARRAQRNLVKLIRSGQAGNAGMPHGKQGQGQGQQPGDKRDPGREPAPGSGRMPRNTF